MRRAKIPVLVIAFLFSCLTAAGQEASTAKPDFSGTWVFNPERSSLQIPVPDSSVFVVDHEDPHWRLKRTHVYAGRSDTLAFALKTDGEPTTLTIRETEIHACLSWEGETLVFESRYRRQGTTRHNVVRYSLTDEGRTFVAEERLESEQESHDNLWVFEKSEEPPPS